MIGAVRVVGTVGSVEVIAGDVWRAILSRCFCQEAPSFFLARYLLLS